MPKRQKTGGRTAGTPNKITKTLKQDILDAAQLAHPEGRVGYLVWASKEQPTAFMSLLGKVLPTEIQPLGSDGNPTDKFVVEIIKV